MAKRRRSVSLSFVLLRFVAVMLGCMLLCCLIWLAVQARLQSAGVVYEGGVSNRQAEQMLAGEPTAFSAPSDDFLAEYARFGPNGEALESNVEGKKREELVRLFREDVRDVHISRHTYADGSAIILRWHYRKEFADPALRRALPPFESLWWASLGLACLLCLAFNTLWLRRGLAAKLKLFSDVSGKIGARELDFVVPRAGIREYDQALDAMERMREALYRSLSAQWAAQREREAEIAALAHDLKTPLTLVGGNAELLLDEELPPGWRKRVEAIAASNDRARQYVAKLLETSAGMDEAFENADLPALFDELCRNALPVAEAGGVCLRTQNGLRGAARIQKSQLLRALGNVAQNAVEHTPPGGNVCLEGRMTEGGWKVTVCDGGPGFSKTALRHATERLWRGDAARGADGHHGLGLWFASQVVKRHAGRLELDNSDAGGVVIASFAKPPETPYSAKTA